MKDLFKKPEHSVENVLDDIEWRNGALASLRSVAPKHIREYIDELEEMMEEYGLVITDLGDRDVYGWVMTWPELVRLETLMARIVLWVNPEEAKECVNPVWIEREGLEL